jgi:hypothetical protein
MKEDKHYIKLSLPGLFHMYVEPRGTSPDFHAIINTYYIYQRAPHFTFYCPKPLLEKWLG